MTGQPDANAPRDASVDLGRAVVALLVPFTFRSEDRRQLWRFSSAAPESCVSAFYRSKSEILSTARSSAEHLLGVVRKVDAEVHSAEYLQSGDYTRASLGAWGLRFTADCVSQVILTFHEDGWGSLLFTSTHPWTFSELMAFLKRTHRLDNSFRLTHAVTGKTMRATDALIACRHHLTGGRWWDRRIAVDIGDAYPFVALFDERLEIHDIAKAFAVYGRHFYGLANCDFWGWHRTRSTETAKLLDSDLSRRDEYAFFITPAAALEIDTVRRERLVTEWAMESRDMHVEAAVTDSHAVDDLRLQLHMERILELETLRVQHHLMRMLDREVSSISSGRRVSFRELARLRRLVADGLNDFHNIRSQNRSHVAGVEWIARGQEIMGIRRLNESLKERIESLELWYDVNIKASGYHVSTVLSVLSVLLAATASSQLVSMLFEIPWVQRLQLDHMKWLVNVFVFSGFVLLTLLAFVWTTRATRSRSM